jgi:ComF family protein
MQIVDKVMGMLAPQVCLGCGMEGSVLCDSCIELYHEPVQPRCAGCHALSKDFRVCSKCRSWLPLSKIYVAGNYEGVSEQLVKALKFEQKRQSSEPISKIIANLLQEISKDTLLCPVPTAPKRVRERGFDHALLISKNLSSLIGFGSKILLRRKSNVRQLGSSRKQRITQVLDEFEVIDKSKIIGKNILLVDDVMTTGATLSAVAQILKSAGAKQVSATIFAQKI